MPWLQVLLGRLGIHVTDTTTGHQHRGSGSVTQSNYAVTSGFDGFAYVGLCTGNTILALPVCCVSSFVLILVVSWPRLWLCVRWYILQHSTLLLLMGAGCVAVFVLKKIFVQRRSAYISSSHQIIVCSCSVLLGCLCSPGVFVARVAVRLVTGLAGLFQVSESFSVPVAARNGQTRFFFNVVSAFKSVVDQEKHQNNPVCVVAVYEFAKMTSVAHVAPRRLRLPQKWHASRWWWGQKYKPADAGHAGSTVQPAESEGAGTDDRDATGDTAMPVESEASIVVPQTLLKTRSSAVDGGGAAQATSEICEQGVEWGAVRSEESLQRWLRTRNRWCLLITLSAHPQLRSLRRSNVGLQQQPPVDICSLAATSRPNAAAGTNGNEEDQEDSLTDTHSAVTPLRRAGDILLRSFFEMKNHKSTIQPHKEHAITNIGEAGESVAGPISDTASDRDGNDTTMTSLASNSSPGTKQLTRVEVDAALGMLTDYAHVPKGPHRTGRLAGVLPRLRPIPKEVSTPERAAHHITQRGAVINI